MTIDDMCCMYFYPKRYNIYGSNCNQSAYNMALAPGSLLGITAC